MKIRMFMLALLCTMLSSVLSYAGVVAMHPTNPSICINSIVQFKVDYDRTNATAWTSSNTSVATVGSTGVVTGVGAGTATISYSIGGGSIYAATTVTVEAGTGPGAITGDFFVCSGQTKTLTASAGGGTWSSSNTAVGTVSSAGVVGGMVAENTTGLAIISYSLGGNCVSTIEQTVNPIVSGHPNICLAATGHTYSVSLTTSGGTWTSSNTAVATIDASTGHVTGISHGTTVMTYKHPDGCKRWIQAMIDPPPVVLTPSSVFCSGTSITATCDFGAGYAWESSNTGVATINLISGIATVTGISAGTTTITYWASNISSSGMLPDRCYQTAVLTVNITPSVITGPGKVCEGATITLGNTSTGGTWSSHNPSVASIESTTGIVTGITTGTTEITYANGCGAAATTIITVDPSPSAIGGPLSVCPGSTITLNNGMTGGSWTSALPSVATIGTSSGIASGISAGTSTITYSMPTGCSTTAIVTVNPLPAAITGTLTVNAGSTTTLSDADAGGTWSISDATKATIGTGTGIVSGLSDGITVVTYTLPTGCFVTAVVTVSCPSTITITGSNSICANTTTMLTAVPTGGTWVSGNTSVATVDMISGIVTGVTSGTVKITYMFSATCYTTKILTLTSAPAAITGDAQVCHGLTISLSTTTTGGTWSVTPSSGVLNVSPSGVVTGNVTNTALKYYTSSSAQAPATATVKYNKGGCFSSIIVSVYPIPTAVTGTPGVGCVGSTVAMSATYPSGGSWVSNNTAVATIDASTGITTPVAAGTAPITYSENITTLHCFNSNTLNTYDPHLSGSSEVCKGSTTTLTPTSSPGTWSSSNTAVATVGSTGVVTGAAIGTTNITYTTNIGNCVSVKTMTVVNCTPKTGGNDLSSTQDVIGYSIVPNPSDGNITISGTRSEKPVDVRVVNYVGTTVYTGQLNMATGESSLKLNNLAAGMYIVELRGENGYTGTHKIVIEK